MPTTTTPRVPVTRTHKDPMAAAEYDRTDTYRARLDAEHPEWVGQQVKILASTGTGRVSGRGTVIGFIGVGLVAVKKTNGKQIGINTAWLVRA